MRYVLFCATLLLATEGLSEPSHLDVALNEPLIKGDVLVRWPVSAKGLAVLPDGVRHLVDGAFAGCSNITTVAFSSEIESIGAFAFARCRGLTEVKLPPTTTNVGEYAFFHCLRLTNVVIGAAIQDVPRGMCEMCIRLERVELSRGLRIIGGEAFRGCCSLRSVTMPECVTNISEFAFAECSSLESVALPSKFIVLGDRAFARCYKLKNLHVPEGMAKIGKDTFLDNGLANREVGPAGLAKIVRLAAVGILQEDSDHSIDLQAMNRFAAHADAIWIGMSVDDVEDVVRRFQYGFGHGSEVLPDNSVVNTVTCIKFGSSRNGSVNLSLEYRDGRVQRIELSEALRIGAREGIKKQKAKVGDAELQWL